MPPKSQVRRAVKALGTYLLLVANFSWNAAEEENDSCDVIRTEDSFVRSPTTVEVRLWPTKRIPYELAPDLREHDRRIFYEAVDNYHQHTCLSLEAKTADDQAFLQVSVDFKNTHNCGGAYLCYQGPGNKQVVRIGHHCSNVMTFVHEIGHALCLDHEMERVDRNNYLDFSRCNDQGSIPRITDSLTTRGHIFDYYSQMHYACRECTGLPKVAEVKRCGPDINQEGLSVTDADKLNSYYNCGGCHGHRWYRVDTLASSQKSTLVNFASEGTLYLCRGYFKGKLFPGKYIESEKACELAIDRPVSKITRDIQLFALPNGPTKLSNTSSSGYRLLHPLDKGVDRLFVPVGRSELNEKMFAAIVEIRDENGNKITELGYMAVEPNIKNWAGFGHNGLKKYIPAGGKDADFFVIGCN